ncbi:dihydrofolate reductase family protein [Mesorhizobium sp. SP-1A]|uniref:dihydrofolate reductase family protein n=1 Tax=Mesorhizobium sp. SP-1A TaxID=3077840 RepID=UPI0028F71B32|nr:dihydrofolate reductase family protein [Mesorhizobium sp. SP-1A]
MTTAHVFIAASLDGYIACKDGNIDWLSLPGGETEDHGYNDFFSTIDGIIMGRGTYDVVSTFGDWPFEKPTIVLTSSLKNEDLPANQKGKVRFLIANPAEALKVVGDDGWKRAYIDGGKVIQSFLQVGLIEDMIISRIPILLGEGLPLFGFLDSSIPLKHLNTRSFASGLVQSKYAIRV